VVNDAAAGIALLSPAPADQFQRIRLRLTRPLIDWFPLEYVRGNPDYDPYAPPDFSWLKRLPVARAPPSSPAPPALERRGRMAHVVAEIIAILEDDPRRVAEMRACLAEMLRGLEVVFFENAAVMIEWLTPHRADVVLISLDHDLPLKSAEGETIDCGTGRQVADFLATLEPTCPVIVHSSNLDCAREMLFALADGGWTHSQVYPRDDLAWIRDAWREQITQYVRSGWISLP